MKTPCLKCGLVHEEATAICEGYVGLDPDETASDTKKQAAARIRAILAAVPIEKRPAGRGKRAAESASNVAEMKPAAERSSIERALDRAAERTADDAARIAEQEMPEWRREVSERLESYRQRRERQTRAAAAGQSVLEFRLHSKKDAGGVAEDSTPAIESRQHAAEAATHPEGGVGNIVDSHREQSPRLQEAAATSAMVAEPPSATSEASSPESSAAAPRAMAATAAAGAGNGSAAARRGRISIPPSERVYAPADVRPTEPESTFLEVAGHALTEAPPEDIEELAYPTAEKEAETFVPEARSPMVATEDETATELTSGREIDSELLEEGPGSQALEALRAPADPGVVLAEPTTLELHADPMEAEEVVSSAPASSLRAPAPEPSSASSAEELPLAIPPADEEYWRTASAIEPDTILDSEVEECGSLTSGVEIGAAATEERLEAISAQLEKLEEEELQEEEAHPEIFEPAAELAEQAEQASTSAAEAGIEAAPETPLPLEAAASQSAEYDPRREALRTASRRSAAPLPERIEISVPQPVFDFSPASSLAEHPQDQQVPVADLRERRCSGAIDAVILALTVGAFFFAFHLAGGELSFSRVGAAVVLAASFLIYAQYFLLFTVTAGATPGMMLRGLRVVCFDGTAPGTLELAWRAFGGLLSAAAGMLGFVWAAWDEDGLTWHDRISQTYISYAELEAQPAHASAH